MVYIFSRFFFPMKTPHDCIPFCIRQSFIVLSIFQFNLVLFLFIYLHVSEEYAANTKELPLCLLELYTGLCSLSRWMQNVVFCLVFFEFFLINKCIQKLTQKTRLLRGMKKSLQKASICLVWLIIMVIFMCMKNVSVMIVIFVIFNTKTLRKASV